MRKLNEIQIKIMKRIEKLGTITIANKNENKIELLCYEELETIHGLIEKYERDPRNPNKDICNYRIKPKCWVNVLLKEALDKIINSKEHLEYTNTKPSSYIVSFYDENNKQKDCLIDSYPYDLIPNYEKSFIKIMNVTGINILTTDARSIIQKI